ncbi:MAG: LPS export ABC transporter permease LptF [Alphaproteobacteria bacterium]
MKIFNLYLFKNLAITAVFVTLVLTFIIFLTQSLRFLEIVMNAGSSGTTFWILTSLALPRFFEVILPISVMAATLFLYNKMTIDSEIIAMRATGHSSFALAKPAIILGFSTTIILWIITMWVAPISLAKMHDMRGALKSEFSAFLFKEGVFNQIGKGLTVYIREKRSDGELTGLMIHDTRDQSKPPSTILAKRGIIVSNEHGQQVIVSSGTRQEYNPKSKILTKLDFGRYTIDLPDTTSNHIRWAEPDERTIHQLLNPDLNNKKDLENLHDFSVEVHRRFTAPLLACTFPLIALTILLLGPVDRRGQTKKIIISVILIMLLQGLFLTSYNLARNNDIGLILMYIVTFLPIPVSLFWLSGYSEKLRRQFLFGNQGETA